MSLENIDPNATQTANDSAQTTGTALSLDTLSGAPAHGPQLDSTPKVQLAASDRTPVLFDYLDPALAREADGVEKLLKAGIVDPEGLGLPPRALPIVAEMLGKAKAK